MRARPGAVGAQRPLPEHHRIGGLEDFQRRDRRGRDRRVAVVEPVASMLPPWPPPKNENITQRCRSRPVPASDKRVDGAVGVGRPSPFGRGLRHRRRRPRRSCAGWSRCSRPRVSGTPRREASPRARGPRPAQHAGIGGQVGEDVLDRDVAGGDRRGPGDVDRPGAVTGAEPRNPAPSGRRRSPAPRGSSAARR
jgi:hypothetical protein